ncbi:hypothetical protein [Aureibacter tunicatorum]|uniref:Cytochrome c domain-containing protein n=1 Tax=Aureibacter tunicatorum TaxID=866807 RepID=A0AAE4BS48_9BACT|nr:hypothetical protein [Aureibacter tunicatorum]MDR6240849.1 hypothetical protein [Aureibacter tunicatorum]BDD06818.1 hypothetical protein AUTU_43010 [Aureibacter tunicatorum]
MRRITLACCLLLGSVSMRCSKAIIDERDVLPIEEVVTYRSDVQGIILSYCTTCHGKVTPSDGLDLTTLEGVKYAVENRNLLERINSSANPMPQNGLMPTELRLKIQKWVDDGFPE